MADLSKKYSSEENDAMKSLLLFGIISAFALVILATAGLIFESTISFLLNPGGNTTVPLSSTILSLEYILALMVPISIGAYFFLWCTYRKLASIWDGFHIPKWLTFLLLAMAPVLIGLLFSYLNLSLSLAQLSSQTNPPPSPLVEFSLLVYIAVIQTFVPIFAVVVLFGVFGGVILGLWRTGRKYKRLKLKLAAILAIFPIADIVSAILVIISAWEIRKEIMSSSAYSLTDIEQRPYPKFT